MIKKILKIPYGMTDFGAIRREGYYYVDKTRFIRKLEEEGIFVFFLRPRRFGKSLMLAMLQAYYDVRYLKQFDELFSGLDIYNAPTPKHNTYLVMNFNFSGIDSSKENVMDSFNADVMLTLNGFILNYEDILPKGTYTEFKTYKKSDEALKFVLDQVKRTGRKIYLLIDEYDNFANTLMAENEEDYRTITHGVSAFRLFFNILKLATTGMDSSLGRMFITGVSPLTLSDVTSGFNIGENFSLQPDYNDMMGFTEEEVCSMLMYYRDTTGVFNHSVDEILEIIKPWYNNNCFSNRRADNQRMFNSDMTLYFIKKYVSNHGSLPESMIDTNVRSDYNKIRRMIRMDKSFGENNRIMQKILEDKWITGSLVPEFSIEDLLISENLVSHLFYMGLLTYGYNSGNRLGFVIPNQVVYEQYYRYMEDCYKRIMNWFTDSNILNSYRDIMVYDGNAKPLLEYICQQITIDSSIRDFDPQAESFVKGFLLAKLGGCNNSYFTTETEREENHGYSDIYMEPWNDKCRHSFLIELKYCSHSSTNAEVTKRCEEARNQVKRYTTDRKLCLKTSARGWVLHCFVIVFRGWQCEICEEI